MPVIAIVVAVFVALMTCERYIARGCRPSVWIAIVAAIFGALMLFAWSIDWSMAFTLSYWTDTKWGILNAGLPLCGLFGAISLIPASFVVFFYQRRWKKHETNKV
jgi:hypothetical protein